MWIRERAMDWGRRRREETHPEWTGMANDGSYRYNAAHRWFRIGVKYSEMSNTLTLFKKHIEKVKESLEDNRNLGKLNENEFIRHKRLLEATSDLASSSFYKGEELLMLLDGYELTKNGDYYIGDKIPFGYISDYLSQRNIAAFIYQCEKTLRSGEFFLEGVEEWLQNGGEFQTTYSHYLDTLDEIDQSKSICRQIDTGANLLSSGFRIVGLFTLVRCIEHALRNVCRFYAAYNDFSEETFAEMVKKLSEVPLSDSAPPLLDMSAKKLFNDLRGIRNSIAHWDTGQSIEGEFLYSCSKEVARTAISALEYLAKHVRKHAPK